MKEREREAVCELCFDSSEDLQRVPVVFEDEHETVRDPSKIMTLCASCREECEP